MIGRAGQIAVHRSGNAVVLSHRKQGLDTHPLPGWWIYGTGGLADRALESDDWQLVDNAALFQFLSEARS